ncbi:glycosyltransferase family 4 protein [Candidatus Woesearchaeota archaeon]|nr:glycosyltransferase family 4 protein [Candidatus Woesearchaeota archaeon]
MKKILITTDSFLPRLDGVSRFLSELIPDLSKKYKVTIIAPEFEGENPVFQGTSIIRIPLLQMRFGDIYFSKFSKTEIKKLVKENDVIFNNTIGPIGITAIREAYKLKKPVISYVHSVEWDLAAEGVKHFHGFVRSAVKCLAKYLYNKCALIMVPSKEMEDLLTRQKIKTKKKVITLGINTELFVPAESKDRAKASVNINPKMFIIGFCGRLSREKDLLTLFKAFDFVQNKHQNTRLLIVGEGIELDFMKDPGVINVGSKKNVIPFFQAMDIYVIPSLTETSSLSTMEAMSCGVPVIATPVGSIKEYVIDEETGLLFPRGDISALQEKIETLFHDSTLLKSLSIAGREIIIKKRQWNKTLAQILKTIESYL